MKNMKYGRTLLALALVLVVLGSVVGGTIAWFTDEVESAGNVIKSGTLDMKVFTTDETGTKVELTDGSDPLFDYKYWEPGYVAYKPLTIKNAGDLAFKYKLMVKTEEAEDATASEYNLADVIDVYVLDEEPTREALANATSIGTIGQLSAITEVDPSDYDGVLLPEEGSEDYNTADTIDVRGSVDLYVALKMQETAGNEYQNLSIGDGFSLVALAAQYTWENDDFDHTYDEDAEWPNDLPVAGMTPITGNDLIVTLSDRLGTLGGVPTDMLYEGTTDKLKLDCGLTFTATQTPEEIVGKIYENWNADFTVTVNKDITAADCQNGIVPLILVGQYDFYDANWIPIPVTADDTFQVTANEPVRLLTMAGAPWSYEDILRFVTEFDCGVKADPSWATPGTQVFVQLRVYEVDENGDENGNSHVVKNYTHTY